jgi:hypothetical protein
MSTLAQDTRVLLEVGDAMAELVATYAVYPMPDGNGPAHIQSITGTRAIARARRDALHRDSKLTWADQLALAYLEVLAEPAPGALHDLLLKLAATAGLWASDLDRRHGDDPVYAAARANRIHIDQEATD